MQDNVRVQAQDPIAEPGEDAVAATVGPRAGAMGGAIDFEDEDEGG